MTTTWATVEVIFTVLGLLYLIATPWTDNFERDG